MKKLPINRRKFLRAATQGAGAIASMGVLPPSVQRALAQTVSPGSLSNIEHVVILVQENRSFDHYFGAYAGVRGFGDPQPQWFGNFTDLPADQRGRSVFRQPGASDPAAYRYPYPAARDGVVQETISDPAHDWTSGHNAVDSGRYDGWMAAKGNIAFPHYMPQNIPLHAALADNFTICDNYYCSVPSNTTTNRLFLWSGTCKNAYQKSDATTKDKWTWTTFADLMEDQGISWMTYQETDNYGDNPLEGFTSFNEAPAGSQRRERAMTKQQSGQSLKQFKQECLNNSLPAVSYIVGPRQTTEHPSWSPSAGADYISEILDALASNTTLWNSTVFLITYDENGGFYDHVVPPLPPTESFQSQYLANEKPSTTSTYYTVGNRVPTFIISPWTRGGKVCSEAFDHTSVNRFLEKWIKVKFGKTLEAPNVSLWRETIFGDLTSAFDFSATQTSIPSKPSVSPVGGSTAQSLSVPSGTSRTLAQQALAVKALQPLPYQLNITARRGNNDGKIWLDMTNTGSAGCSVRVVMNDFRDYQAFSYVVPAKTPTSAPVSDFFSAASNGGGKYDMTAYGPNGFVRRFRGNINAATAQIEIVMYYDTAANRVGLKMTNPSASAVQVKVSTCGYRTDGPWSYTVPARESGQDGVVQDTWYTVDGWYDLVAFVPNDPSFLRVFAGHIEGKVSKTFPRRVIPRSAADVVAKDSEASATEAARNVLNGNPMQGWQSDKGDGDHFITVDLGGVRTLAGLTYLPRQDSRADPYKGMIKEYQVHVSTDNTNWKLKASGSWAKSFSLKTAKFSATSARYVRLTALSDVNDTQSASAAEINFLTA